MSVWVPIVAGCVGGGMVALALLVLAVEGYHRRRHARRRKRRAGYITIGEGFGDRPAGGGPCG